jgi:hypothetical protein
MLSNNTYSHDLNTLIIQREWDAAKALFDRGHESGEMPLAKGCMLTRRMLVDLLMHRQVEVPVGYFYAGCRQTTTYQILNYLKRVTSQNPDGTPDFDKRARSALDIVVKGCTEMLPDSFRHAAEMEVYAKAAQLGFPKDYLADLMTDNAFKRALLESDLVL